ncbi:YrdC domain-containing protein, mitochondrial [Oopsacas minuta]|uniref:Threonylcarbamoyl-AMP synthase n=1 Tax=Oopsacas minuta TaxID=111878 RepID=A0AAV7JXV3_9METZ|nr:YrdC domain-containing protein, mitochondrial [Oopsacas minuta]
MADFVAKPLSKIIRVSGLSRDTKEYNNALEETAKVLEDGGLIGVPTDTIYGIACLASISNAVKNIYELKGRAESKPLAICVPTVESISHICKVSVDNDLLHDLLPGPVTLVFERSPELNPDLNPTHSKVGIRIPKFSYIQDLAVICSYPLALTSANYSSQTSSTTVEEFKPLWEKLDLVIDAGRVGTGSKDGSTVVDLSTNGRYQIIRQGCAMENTLAVLRDKYKLLSTD